ncbi:MAG: glycosyltransferase family 1 protein [Anaerolineae bacterium]|nr:glycosyltransferase family 1 protein [Anaerolineae bacterium]
MRVVYFTETFLPKIDGIVSIMCLLLDHLQTRGVPAMVVTAERGVREYDGAQVHGVPGLPAPFYPELHLTLPGPGTYRAMRAFAPTIVHLIHPSVTGMPGIYYARRLGVPLIASFHTNVMQMARYYHFGLIERLLTAYTRWTYNRADFTLATSRRMARELQSIGIRNVGLWRRGVDPAFFGSGVRTPAMRARLTDGHPDRVICLFVGRAAPEKRIELLREVVTNIPNTHVTVVGEGPHLAALREHFAGTRATFAGYLTGQDLADAYASADIFTFMSAVETFGMVVPEAMAAGLPVISTRVGGIDDVATHGADGFLIEREDVAGLVEYTRRLVEDPDRRLRMGARGKAAVQGLTWPVIMDELLDMYQMLVDGARPATVPPEDVREAADEDLLILER